MNPESRKTQLLAQTVGDDLVIYDERTHEAHRLSATAAVVWQAADGHAEISDLAAALRAAVARLGDRTALDDDTSQELARLAIAELDRAGLLVERMPALSESMSRREMIGVTAALLPVVLSIVAPTPSMAQTTTVPPPSPLFNFGRFNGLYSGNGAPGTPNICGFGARPVTVNLNITGIGQTVGSGSLIIIHTGATTFTTSPANATVLSPTSISVTGAGTGGGFTTQNSFTFTLTGTGTAATVSGAQQLAFPECGTTPYNITGSKP